VETTETSSEEALVERMLAPLAAEDAPEADEQETVEPGEYQPQADAADDQDQPEEDEAEEEAAAPEQPQTFAVKVDGREVQVTLDELKRGYSGTAYIQQGMQQAAEARKAAEAEIAALREAQAQFVAFAQQVQQTGFVQAPTPPNPSMADEDPIGYMQERARYDQAMTAYQQQQAQLQQYQTQIAQQTEAQRRAFLAQQQQLLVERIPEFGDAQKAAEIKTRLREVGKGYGFSDEELGGIADARAVQVLHDAAQWRALQAAKASGQTPKAPPSVKPGARTAEAPNRARAKQLETARKSGRPEDFVDLLLEPKR